MNDSHLDLSGARLARRDADQPNTQPIELPASTNATNDATNNTTNATSITDAGPSSTSPGRRSSKPTASLPTLLSESLSSSPPSEPRWKISGARATMSPQRIFVNRSSATDPSSIGCSPSKPERRFRMPTHRTVPHRDEWAFASLLSPTLCRAIPAPPRQGPAESSSDGTQPSR
jgi:hypothetical protein